MWFHSTSRRYGCRPNPFAGALPCRQPSVAVAMTAVIATGVVAVGCNQNSKSGTGTAPTTPTTQSVSSTTQKPGYGVPGPNP